MNSIKRQKNMTPEDDPPPRSEGIQYAPGRNIYCQIKFQANAYFCQFLRF